MTRDLRDVKLLLTLMADSHVTAAELSQEKTALRWTVLQRMRHAMLPRISLRQDLLTDAKSSFLMQLA